MNWSLCFASDGCECLKWNCQENNKNKIFDTKKKNSLKNTNSLVCRAGRIVKINWLGSLAMTICNLGFTSIFQWLRKDIWPWCACDRGSGQEGPSEVLEPNPMLLTSCSSAASFTPLESQKRLDQSLPPHTWSNALPSGTGHSSSGKL